MILFYGGKEEEDILKERPEEWLGHEERRKKLEVLCNEVSSSFKNRGKNVRILPSCIDIISGTKSSSCRTIRRSKSS